MSHLHPIDRVFEVSGRQITVRFEFGFHVFTDDKENGPLLTDPRTREQRYFCQHRYDCSKQLVDYIDRRFIESKVRLYYGHRNNTRYFCMDLHDYAIFFELRKPQNLENFLRLNVISAYEVDSWGRGGLPSKGKLLNVTYVLEKRNAGEKL